MAYFHYLYFVWNELPKQVPDYFLDIFINSFNKWSKLNKTKHMLLTQFLGDVIIYFLNIILPVFRIYIHSHYFHIEKYMTYYFMFVVLLLRYVI
jgi:hypothetical protein